MAVFSLSTSAIAVLLALLPWVQADTCSSVESSTNIEIEYPLSVEYSDEQTNYWSAACSSLKPSCILKPSTVEEVAAIVKILNNNDENFAIKSGGHNPNDYFASIDGGPLISTGNLNEVVYDAATNLVKVGPGLKWEDVSAALEPSGVSIVGGRIGNVGVGGYMLGLGLSFQSSQYGWAVNNDKEFEVVLANATIVTASADENADLYNALKGGGNNYGIIASYTVEAHPQGQVWGGTLTFDHSQADAILAATREFTENYPDDKAAVIVTTEITLETLLNSFIVFVFYDGPTPPEGTFDAFLDVGPTLNTAKTQSFTDLLTANNFGVVKGLRYNIGNEMTTLPNAANGPEVMGAYYDAFVNTTYSVLEATGLLASMAFQPMPKTIVQKAQAQGGDLLDLDDSVDRIVFELDLAHSLPIDDDIIDEAMVGLYTKLNDLVSGFIADDKIPDGFLPLFQNDCYFRQDYFGRLRPEKGAFAADVRDAVDPDGFFKTRTGGFKISDDL